MKSLFGVACAFGAALLLDNSVAQAQSTAPNFPEPGSPARPAPASLIDPARTRRQQQMSPEDAARDQQMQLLEARTGNTSFGADRNGPYRQFDKAGNAFTVRKFKALPGQEQKRGVSRRVQVGSDPKGKPLVHSHGRKKRFLFF